MYILDKICEIHCVVTFDAAFKLLIILHRVRLMRRCCNTGLLSRCSALFIHTHTHTLTVLEAMHVSYDYLLKRIIFCLVLCLIGDWFNLLKPTGHVMHQQFIIQQLYALPTLYLCVLYLSENKQRLVPLTA